MAPIKMADLQAQYLPIKSELDEAIFKVIDRASFINGEEVGLFTAKLANYLGVKHCIPCANGTDALQIAIMALALPANAEIIVPSFSYVAAAEAVAFLGYKPVFVDVDEDTYNIDVASAKNAVNENTRAIIPVHLFGQCCHMLTLLKFAQEYNLYVIEDAAQSIGASYYFPDNTSKYAGCIGHIGITSFFPTKNLGCMGDGGAIFTNDDELADKMKTIANHGQKKKYVHEIIGVNSRLDTLQAAILNVKLSYLDQYVQLRQKSAGLYDVWLNNCEYLETPLKSPFSSHVYNQYTLKIKKGNRNGLKNHLESRGIPTMIYYPVPLHQQPAFNDGSSKIEQIPVSEKLCETVISLPMHTQLDENQIDFICKEVTEYLNGDF